MLIQIIEDDKALAELIKTRVEEEGYKTALAYTAKDALAWLENHVPHIMLLDYTLPDMNAKEFIEELIAHQKPVPSFIISTGGGDERIAVDMMKSGARDYIRKDSLFLEMLPALLRKVSGEIETENKLKETEANYRLLAENACDVIWILDLSTMRFRYISPSVEKMRGYTVEEALEQELSSSVCPISFAALKGSLPERLSLYKNGLTDNGFFDEIEQPRKDGSTVWTEATSRIVPNKASGHLEIIGVSRDITQRRVYESKVNTLLSEKDLILKEVHHRIKNNMNTIKSLLSLQAGTLRDEEAVHALDDAQSRIDSMMILYDKLYNSEDFNEISVAEYIPTLVDEIIEHFPNAGNVTIEKNIDPFFLDAKKLQPLGIIINELITNIMKYAFTDKTEGKIFISASMNDNQVFVIIADNGIGMPESVNFGSSTGFGLTLVAGLVKQLRGKIRIERENGTRIILEFRKY